MWRSSLAVVLALGPAVFPASARACKCAGERPPPARARADADLVVEAQVDAHDFVADRGFVTRLTTRRVFKGAPAHAFELAAAKTCAVGFTPGTRWLVYAYADGDGGFTTTFCSRTAPIADARDDLRVLAEPPRMLLPTAWSNDPFVQLLRLAALAVLAAG